MDLGSEKLLYMTLLGAYLPCLEGKVVWSRVVVWTWDCGNKRG